MTSASLCFSPPKAKSEYPIPRRLVLVPAAPAPRRGDAVVRRFRLARLEPPAPCCPATEQQRSPRLV
jgi:hypothetical protein